MQIGSSAKKTIDHFVHYIFIPSEVGQMTDDNHRHEGGEELEEAMSRINSRTGRNMPQAIATGAGLVLLVLASVIFNPQPFVWLVLVFICIALWELRVDFAVAGLRIPVVALWICSTCLLLCTYYAPAGYHQAAAVAGILLTLVITIICASFNIKESASALKAAAGKTTTTTPANPSASAKPSQLQTPQVPAPGRFRNVMATILAVFYVPFLATFIVLPVTMKHYLAHVILLVFVPALGDTGGLIFGAWLGKHKLSPRISPKKSVEGLIGSVLFTLVGTLFVGLCTYSIQELTSNWWILAILGILIGVTGLFGDLSASMLKRDLGIKDMGHLLKGHGGVLDRADSILMCAPVIYIVLYFCGL